MVISRTHQLRVSAITVDGCGGRDGQMTVGFAWSAALWRSTTRAMSDLVEHYRTTVGQILDQATVGGLRVCLELVDGRVIMGTPPRDASDEDRNPDTGSLRS